MRVGSLVFLSPAVRRLLRPRFPAERWRRATAGRHLRMHSVTTMKGVEIMRFLTSLLLLCAIAVVGCSEKAVVPETSTESVIGLIKPILEKIAETGDREAVGELKSYIEESLAGVDQAKSDALMKDYNELQSMSGSSQIKAKAQEMLSKL